MGVAATVLMLAGCSAGAVPRETAPAAVPGPAARPADAPDSYYPRLGNAGYDVASYALTLRYDPAKGDLAGTAMIGATAERALTSVRLDLDGLRATKVTVDGEAAAGSTAGGKLTVTPAAALARGEDFTVVVHYDGRLGGNAAAGRAGPRRTGEATYALAGPASASAWFPANDRPDDKATFALEMSVPAGLTAVSNGVPAGSATAGGRTTWRWSEPAPMTPTRAFFLVGDYRLTRGVHAGKPVVTAVPGDTPRDGAQADALARTGEIADWLERRFGPYPFGAYGAVVVGDDKLRPAPAPQTRAVFASRELATPATASAAVARGLAEQWFGASVTPGRWEDAWLGEGFATYAQWLWTEHDGGATVEQAVHEHYETFPWQAFPAADPGPDLMFSPVTGDRGAMALHALRRRIGDTAFFGLLQGWAAGRAHGTATTADFVTAAGKAAGQDLGGFFDVWLNGEYRPTY